MVFQTGKSDTPVSLRWILLGTLLSWGSLASAPFTRAAEPPRIAVVFRPEQSYHLDAVSGIQRVLQPKGYSCVLIELPASSLGPTPLPAPKSPAKGPTSTAPAPAENTSSPAATTLPQASALDKARRQLADAKPTVIVTAGTRAIAFALETIPRTPLIFCMVPNGPDMGFMAVGNPNRSRLAGVTTDVAPRRQIDWIVKLKARPKNLGLFHSARSKRTAEAIVSAAKARGITVSLIEARKDQFPKAIEALNAKGCDGALMIADASVYNSANIRRLLLWGLRQKKPVWTFSDNIVKAGAFAGLYTDGRAIGEQAAGLVQKVIAGADVSTIGLQYPTQVRSAINERTAEMIGIPLTRRILEQVTLRFGKER